MAQNPRIEKLEPIKHLKAGLGAIFFTLFLIVITIFFSMSFSPKLDENIKLWKDDGLAILKRGLTNSIHFIFVIYGSSFGIPVVTQTLSSTAPLFLHLHFYITTKQIPNLRAICAVAVIILGIYFLMP